VEVYSKQTREEKKATGTYLPSVRKAKGRDLRKATLAKGCRSLDF